MARQHVEHIHAPAIDPQPLAWPGWPAGAQVQPLSIDPETGACSCLLRLPHGWRRPPAAVRSDCEWLVVSGALHVGDRAFSQGSYSFVAAGEQEDDWRAAGPTEVFFAARTGPPDVTLPSGRAAPATHRLAAEHLPWGPTPIANGPPN